MEEVDRDRIEGTYRTTGRGHRGCRGVTRYRGQLGERTGGRAPNQYGPAEQAIIEYATSEPIDQIIMGSHGRTGLSRLVLGSVAETVAQRSPVPVTSYRELNERA